MLFLYQLLKKNSSFFFDLFLKCSFLRIKGEIWKRMWNFKGDTLLFGCCTRHLIYDRYYSMFPRLTISISLISSYSLILIEIINQLTFFERKFVTRKKQCRFLPYVLFSQIKTPVITVKTPVAPEPVEPFFQPNCNG